MECCLRALGFHTCLMKRVDLEPSVTLATSHSLVRVISCDSDKSNYVVDPAYVQFHRELCLDDASAPQDPVLILHENEVDGYIERTLMPEWKRNSVRRLALNPRIRDSLLKCDRLLPYELPECMEVASRNLHDPETWVRKALQKIWNWRTHYPLHNNYSLQSIFCPSAKPSETYRQIESLGIGRLAHVLSHEDIHRRLRELLQDRSLLGKNTYEAILLLGHLLPPERNQFQDLLDRDLRINEGLMEMLNGYYRAVKKLINPEGEDIHVLYGCSESDCMSVLLATDATTMTFVDLTETAIERFEAAFQAFKQGALQDERKQYLDEKHFSGGTSSLSMAVPSFKAGRPGIEKIVHSMEHLERNLFFDLQELGVPLDHIRIRKEQGATYIQFFWCYHGSPAPKNRTLVLIKADLTKPSEYPPVLCRRLHEGIDCFFMKASFYAPEYYPSFLPCIAQSIREGGWIMTSDKTANMELENPEQCLLESRQHFISRKNREIESFEEFMHYEYNPSFVRLPKEARDDREPMTDLTYTVIVNLRQKATGLIAEPISKSTPCALPS